MNAEKTGFWTRVVADASFADAVIDDPLRALSEVTDVVVSTEQVRRLEELTRDERADLVREVVHEAFMKGAVARYGHLSQEGLLGAGGPLPPELRAPEDDEDETDDQGPEATDDR